MNRSNHTVAVLYLSRQSIALVALCVLWFLLSGFTAGLVAVGGAVAYILPQLVFALTMFRKSGARYAKSVVRNFYLGEALKLLMTASILIAILVWLSPPALPLMTTYVAGVLSHFLGSRLG